MVEQREVTQIGVRYRDAVEWTDERDLVFRCPFCQAEVLGLACACGARLHLIAMREIS